MGNASRRKGKRGEAEVAALIVKSLGGYAYAIGGNKDVGCGRNPLDRCHVEVKRRKRISMLEWCEQAERDAAAQGKDGWVVLMREDVQPGGKVRWYAVVEAEGWLAERAVLARPAVRRIVDKGTRAVRPAKEKRT